MNRRACAVLAAVLLVSAAAAEAPPAAPAEVRTGLKILAGVYGDMERKLELGQFERLPHESEEFQEGSGALHDAIAKDPPATQAAVEAALERARGAARAVAETSRSRDAARVRAALDQLAAALTDLNALFPAELRAAPGTSQAHPGKRPGAR